jgi:hypothetical protein
LEEFYSQAFHGPWWRRKGHLSPEWKGQSLSSSSRFPQDDFHRPGPTSLQEGSEAYSLDAPAPTGWPGEGLFQKAIQGAVEGFGSPYGRRKVQRDPDGLGSVEGPDGVQPPTRRPFPRLSSLGSELAHQSRLGQGDEFLQGSNAQSLQSLDHEGIHRQYGNGASGQEGGEFSLGNQNGSPGSGSSRRHPGAEFSRSPAYPRGCHQSSGKDPKKGLEGRPNLSGGGSVETLHAVHSQKNPPAARRLDYGTQVHESLHHFLLGGIVVTWVRFQEGEGGT